jgi:hypothetical protein
VAVEADFLVVCTIGHENSISSTLFLSIFLRDKAEPHPVSLELKNEEFQYCKPR